MFLTNTAVRQAVQATPTTGAHVQPLIVLSSWTCSSQHLVSLPHKGQRWSGFFSEKGKVHCIFQYSSGGFPWPRKTELWGKKFLKSNRNYPKFERRLLIFSSVFFCYSHSSITNELMIVYGTAAGSAVRVAAPLQTSQFGEVINAETSPCPNILHWSWKVESN